MLSSSIHYLFHICSQSFFLQEILLQTFWLLTIMIHTYFVASLPFIVLPHLNTDDFTFWIDFHTFLRYFIQVDYPFFSDFSLFPLCLIHSDDLPLQLIYILLLHVIIHIFCLYSHLFYFCFDIAIYLFCPKTSIFDIWIHLTSLHN